MADLPRNPTYAKIIKPELNLPISSVKTPGVTIPKPSKKAIDLSQFSNLPASVQATTPAQTPTSAVSTPKLAITTPYGGSTKYEKFHPGVDIAGPSGTPIPSFTGGTVSAVQTEQESGGFGKSVIVTDEYGNKHRYSHLKQNWVKVGEKIGRGQKLGAMGATGNVYSQWGGDPSHLDYRVSSVYNQYFSPSTYLKQYSNLTKK